jgi:hypothetical protein
MIFLGLAQNLETKRLWNWYIFMDPVRLGKDGCREIDSQLLVGV